MWFSPSSALAALATFHYTTACLVTYEAETLAANFGKLVSNYSGKLANQTLDPSFIDYSESVNSLINGGGTAPKALLGETFTSRADFETNSASQPAVPFTVKNVWHNCDTVTFRWESDQSPQPVVGISVGHVKLAPLGNPTLWRFDEIWGEFDSAAWLLNLGILQQSSASKKREVAFDA